MHASLGKTEIYNDKQYTEWNQIIFLYSIAVKILYSRRYQKYISHLLLFVCVTWNITFPVDEHEQFRDVNICKIWSKVTFAFKKYESFYTWYFSIIIVE